MALVWTSRASLVLWSALCLRVLAAAELGTDLRAENGDEANFTVTTREAAQGGQQVTPPPQVPVFGCRLRVVDALSRQPLKAALVQIYMNFSLTLSSQTQEEGEVWFHIPHQTRAIISAVIAKQGHVTTLLPLTTDKTPVFSSVTLPLLGVYRGNMWLFNNSVLISKSTGAFGAEPLVHFHSSGLNGTEEGALSAVSAFMNSPSVSAAEGATLHTMGIISSRSGPMCVELTPVASAWVQLVSSGSALEVSSPIHMRLPLCESCGLQEGQHLPAWTLSLSTGAWVRRGLGTVEAVDGRLMWTFTAPHLGHWMAAPLSPSRGVRLEEQLDFLLRHGSFLMILLGSTLVVAVCLLLGLLCHPRPSHTDSKLSRPAVSPLVSVKDQTTSTSEDQVLLLSNHAHKQYNVMSNASTELQQDKNTVVAVTVNHPDEQKPQNKTFENGLFFYNQPVAILHAPGFFQMEDLSEEEWSKSVSLPRMDSKDARENFMETKITNNRTESTKGDVKKFEIKSGIHSGLPESVSEPGRLGQRGAPAQGPRAWFVSLEGKPAAEVRYNVSEEPRRRIEEEGGSREARLDSGLDLGEVNQGRQEVRLERNATFVKKSSQKHNHEKA